MWGGKSRGVRSVTSASATITITPASGTGDVIINLTGGVSGGVAFWTGPNTISQDSANFFWDNTNKQLQLLVGSVALPSYTFIGDTTTGIFRQAAAALGFAIGGNEGARLSAPADGNTALLLRRNVGGVFSLQQVSMGVVDSGGAGFKLLRVPN